MGCQRKKRIHDNIKLEVYIMSQIRSKSNEKENNIRVVNKHFQYMELKQIRTN